MDATIETTLEIVREYVDDCICTYEIEVFGKSIEMIPVVTIHQMLDRIEEEAKRGGIND